VKFAKIREIAEYRIQASLKKDNTASLADIDRYINSSLWLLTINSETQYMPKEDERFVMEDISVFLEGLMANEQGQYFKGLNEILGLIRMIKEEKTLGNSDKEIIIEQIKRLLKNSYDSNVHINDSDKKNTKLQEIFRDFKTNELIPFYPDTNKLKINLVDNILSAKLLKSISKELSSEFTTFKRMSKISINQAMFEKIKKLYELSANETIPEDVKDTLSLIRFLTNKEEPASLAFMDTMFVTLNRQFFLSHVFPEFSQLLNTEELNVRDFEDYFPKSYKTYQNECKMSYHKQLNKEKDHVRKQVAETFFEKDRNYTINIKTTVLNNIVEQMIGIYKSPKKIRIDDMKKELNVSDTDIEFLVQCGLIHADLHKWIKIALYLIHLWRKQMY